MSRTMPTEAFGAAEEPFGWIPRRATCSATSNPTVRVSLLTPPLYFKYEPNAVPGRWERGRGVAYGVAGGRSGRRGRTHEAVPVRFIDRLRAGRDRRRDRGRGLAGAALAGYAGRGSGVVRRGCGPRAGGGGTRQGS